MQIEIVHPIYRCKEKDLVASAIKAWNTYSLHFISFKEFSDFYIEDLAIQQIAYIREIENNYLQQKEQSTILQNQLQLKCKLVCQKWQLLKRYIQGAYPKKFHAFKLKNAGKDYYFTAYRYNYVDLKFLIEISIEFLTNYKIILQLEKNMPETFYNEYIEVCNQFKIVYDEYESKKMLDKQMKYHKIAAFNKLYKPLMEMLNDAKAIFINDKKTLSKFSFNKIRTNSIN